MSGHAEREALLKHLDIFLHSNPEVDLSGIVCKHGLAIEACASRECSNPMAYETAIKRARDYIAANSHADLTEALKGATVAANIAGSLLKEKDAKIEALSDSHADLVKALEEIAADQKVYIGHGDYREEPLPNHECQKIARTALATLTARKVG